MDTNKRSELENQIFNLGIIFLIVVVGVLVILFNIILPNYEVPTCMWNKLLGIYCPGCGGTRSFIALMKGEILLSLWYHPLVIYSVAIYGAFMISHGFAKITKYRYIKGIPFYPWYLYLAIFIIVINVIIKNILLIRWNITL